MADKVEQARGTAADAAGGPADAAAEAAHSSGGAAEPGTQDIGGGAERPSVRPPSKKGERLARACTALFAPLRLLRSRAARGLRWLGRQLKSPLRLLVGLAKSRTGEERGFGFWWLVVTLLLAASVGLLVAVLLTPVTGPPRLPSGRYLGAPAAEPGGAARRRASVSSRSDDSLITARPRRNLDRRTAVARLTVSSFDRQPSPNSSTFRISLDGLTAQRITRARETGALLAALERAAAKRQRPPCAAFGRRHRLRPAASL